MLPYSKTKLFIEGKDLAYNDVTFQSVHGSGLYADRIYFEPCSKTIGDLKVIVDSIISEMAKDIDFQNFGKVEIYLKEYLNIHIVEAEISQKNKVLKTLNGLLDQQELKQNFAFENNHNYLMEYFELKEIKRSVLADDAFDINLKDRKFRSIPEIATTTLLRTDVRGKYERSLLEDFKNEDIQLIDKLKENGFVILPYHKYYAVLYADGDNISALLSKISGEFDDLREFSKRLFDFGIKAEKVIANYGGNGIYLGGEDVLAFLPIACIDPNGIMTQTIFNVIKQLDDCFQETLGTYALEKKVTPPTLSYGIMISYIKHPLKGSMKEAHDLMDKVAKNKTQKNAIGLRFQKHSGQYMECCIEKSKKDSWNSIRGIVEEYTRQVGDEKDKKTKADLLSGVIHRLKDDLFFELYCAAARENRLKAFYENFFDEKIHLGDENPRNIFLQKVRVLSEILFSDYPDNAAIPKHQEFRDIIFTVLRFIHFINSTRE